MVGALAKAVESESSVTMADLAVDAVVEEGQAVDEADERCEDSAEDSEGDVYSDSE